MAEKRLLDYLSTYMQKGYSKNQLMAHLAGSGWSRKVLEEGFAELEKTQAPALSQVSPNNKSLESQISRYDSRKLNPIIHLSVIAVIFVILGAFLYLKFIVINPAFVHKPVLVKPDAPLVGAAISTDQVEWVANELNAYKLRDEPFFTGLVKGGED